METNPRDHLANKRTFLAWVRTSIALMGFGFVIAKFQIFLHILTHQNLNLNTVLGGIIMIIMGISTLLYGLYEYIITEKQLENNEFKPSKMSIIIYTMILLILAIALIISLYINIF